MVSASHQFGSHQFNPGARRDRPSREEQMTAVGDRMTISEADGYGVVSADSQLDGFGLFDFVILAKISLEIDVALRVHRHQ